MKTRVFGRCLIAIAVVMLSTLPVHAEKWSMNEFMISVWGGPADAAMARAYQDAHFNTVMAPIDKVEMCGKHGLKAIVMNATPEIAAANKDNPYVWGWFVKDEPKREQFNDTAVRVSKFHAADPNHPAYVNMMTNMDLDAFFDIVKPRFLSYDYYQWWWGPYQQFLYLDQHSREAWRHGVPLVVWVEVNADPRWDNGKPGATYLPDNDVKLRQSVYTALAYGVKGIQWFVETLFFKQGADKKLLPELNQSGEDVKKINVELEALGPILVKLNSTGVYNTGPAVFRMDIPKNRPGNANNDKPIPPSVFRMDKLPGNLWVITKSYNLTLGLFEYDGDRYVMVVNRDITKQNTARLNFDNTVKRISRFDRLRRQWVDESSDRAILIDLKPGDGELFRAQ